MGMPHLNKTLFSVIKAKYRETLFVLKIPTKYIRVIVLCGQTVEFYVTLGDAGVTTGLKIVYEAFSFIKRYSYFGVVVFVASHLCTHSLG
jgi:hypothetical protein